MIRLKHHVYYKSDPSTWMETSSRFHSIGGIIFKTYLEIFSTIHETQNFFSPPFNWFVICTNKRLKKTLNFSTPRKSISCVVVIISKSIGSGEFWVIWAHRHIWLKLDLPQYSQLSPFYDFWQSSSLWTLDQFLEKILFLDFISPTCCKFWWFSTTSRFSSKIGFILFIPIIISSLNDWW